VISFVFKIGKFEPWPISSIYIWYVGTCLETSIFVKQIFEKKF